MKMNEKCLKIIEEKRELNYQQVYEILKYCQEHTDMIAHVYYVEYGLKKSWKYPNITTSMLGLIEEMNKHCDYPEAKEGFLTDLTVECSKNNVDANSGFIFWSDWHAGCNYMENNKQITQHIVRWLKGVDFDLEDKVVDKIYEVLVKNDTRKIKEECYRMLDQLNEKQISEYTMSKICKPLTVNKYCDQMAFDSSPKYITQYKQLVKYIENKSTYNNPISTALYMSRNIPKRICIFKDKYWVYTDGVNGEIWVTDQNGLIDYIKEALRCCEEYIGGGSEVDERSLKGVYKVLKELLK